VARSMIAMRVYEALRGTGAQEVHADAVTGVED
jgi:hypothetical protein